MKAKSKRQRKRPVTRIDFLSRVSAAKYRKALERGDRYKGRAERYRAERNEARKVAVDEANIMAAEHKEAIAKLNAELHVERTRHESTKKSLDLANRAIKDMQAKEENSTSGKGYPRKSSLANDRGKGWKPRWPGSPGAGKRQ